MPPVACACQEDPPWQSDQYHALKCPAARALRNEWCTPMDIVKVIGEVDLDPCSNRRSCVRAMWKVLCDLGGDGLYGGPGEFRWGTPTGPRLKQHANSEWRVFINPPYEHGAAVRWVRHYAHTNFIFLLRWDPSTGWFEELAPKCWGFWFPHDRVSFVPPPRIRSSSNPFPHALFLAREPTGEILDRLLASGYLVRNVGLGGSRIRTVGEGSSPAEGAGGSGDGARTAGQGPTLRELADRARAIADAGDRGIAYWAAFATYKQAELAAASEAYPLSHPLAWCDPAGQPESREVPGDPGCE